MYTNDFYIQGFTSAKKTIHELVDSIDNQTFNTPPAEDKWCIGEIISHLIKQMVYRRDYQSPHQNKYGVSGCA